MLKSIKPELFDPINRKVGEVYVRVGPKKENDELGTVDFSLEFFYLKTVVQPEQWPVSFTRIQHNIEDGTDVEVPCVRFEERMVKRNYLIPFDTRMAQYKSETFYKHFSELRPENRYEFAINEIDRINQIKDRDEYYFEWTKDDLVIISDDDIVKFFEPTLAEEEKEQ